MCLYTIKAAGKVVYRGLDESDAIEAAFKHQRSSDFAIERAGSETKEYQKEFRRYLNRIPTSKNTQLCSFCAIHVKKRGLVAHQRGEGHKKRIANILMTSAEMLMLSESDLTTYFLSHVEYLHRGIAGSFYCISIDGHKLWDKDTHELRSKFNDKLAEIRKRQQVSVNEHT